MKPRLLDLFCGATHSGDVGACRMNFWDRVDATGDCWEWTGGTTNRGYGITYAPGRQQLAHRYAYESLVGQIPQDMTIDHLCRNRLCVNPDHMEVISRGANALRGYGPAAVNARRTFCSHGHDLANAKRDSRGRRVCGVCARRWWSDQAARRKAARRAA